MKKYAVFALALGVACSASAFVPREDLFQSGGDLGEAVKDGFAIVVPVKMGPDGALSAETERALDVLPGGRKAIVDWQTDDPRSLDLYAAALKRHPAIFEKCHIFTCTNALSQSLQERFIWPRHMPSYRVSDTAADAIGRFRRREFGIAVRNAAKIHAEIAAMESGTGDDVLRLAGAVDRPFLPNDAASSSAASVYARLAELDAAADAKWRSLASREEYDAYRQQLREKMLAALGPFPARTPLNFRKVRTVEREGFRVEYSLFESMPGVFVPASLFVPTGAPKDSDRFPAVVISCGHGEMSYEKYVLAAVDCVRRGMVAFLFEACEQGERVEYSRYNCCENHNLIGLKAMLLGSSFAMFRIWDGMRAVDCVESLPYVDRDRIGYMGQSGGGTMTALMTATDLRLKATAPSGYLTNFGYLCRTMGPQDAEQNIFGQLAFGLNHTGYVLIPDIKVAVTGRFNDMFDYGGTAQLMETVKSVARMLGEEDHYALNFAQGPHGWTESTIQGSAVWMDAWLNGRKDLLPLDNAALRFLDFGFDVHAATAGISGNDALVLGGNPASSLPGARNFHDVLRDRFAAAVAARKPRSADETAALVRRLAAIRLPREAGVRVKEMGEETVGTVRATRLAFVYPDGFALPAVCLERTDVPVRGTPLLLAGSQGRAQMLDAARPALAEGRAVLVGDVIGTGEVVKTDKIHYGSYDVPEEGTSIMLYLMGESMVGRRAGDLLVFADWLKARTGRAAELVAEGSVAVAAAHAFAAVRAEFASVRIENPPPSWTEFLRHPGAPLPYRYTWCVNGALNEYDWTELVRWGERVGQESRK